MANVIMIDYFNPFKQSNFASSAAALASRSLPAYKENVDLTSDNTETGREVIVCPLIEDFQLHIETAFLKPSQLMPNSIQRIMGFMKLLQTAGGQTSRAPNILDILDVPVWDRTEPAKFDIKLQFFVEDDAYTDVVRPAIGLCSLSMLSPNIITKEKSGEKFQSFLLPGINFSNLSGTMKALKGEEKGKDGEPKSLQIDFRSTEFAKLIALEIPGMIYLPVAMVEKADPTFSKEITDSGYPLWSEVTLSITGLRSANTDMFIPGSMNGIESSLNRAAQNYLNNLPSGFFQGATGL
jgi:hypothetical protein